MLRRTKAKLIDSGTLVLPRLTEITVLVFFFHFNLCIYLLTPRTSFQLLIDFLISRITHVSLLFGLRCIQD